MRGVLGMVRVEFIALRECASVAAHRPLNHRIGRGH